MKDNKTAITVVKVGGAVVEDATALSRLLTDFAAIPGRKILVHGGGRRATKVAEALGIKTTMVGGRRITDAAMLEVVTMVYGGLVNKNIVAGLQAIGVNAIGLTGADANIIRAHKRPVKDGVDYGFVGDVDAADERGQRGGGVLRARDEEVPADIRALLRRIPGVEGQAGGCREVPAGGEGGLRGGEGDEGSGKVRREEG